MKPALSWRSRVVYFKVVEPGSPVSYGSTWKSDHRVRLVTVPVGYGDGYFRALSNRALVVLRGQRHPQVGRVCMDQMMVNIEWNEAWNGDDVVLIGEQGEARVTVEELAEWAGTVPVRDPDRDQRAGAEDLRAIAGALRAAPMPASS